MKILVCISKTPDTTAKIAFTDNNTKFDESGVQWIINPYDEWYALVRAIELKEADASTVIHLVTVAGAFDIVFTGKETIDYNGSSIGGMVAELLDQPFISLAAKLELAGTKATLTREIEGGEEICEAELPLVVSAQKGMAEARIPNMRGIMAARTKPLKVVEPVAADSLTTVSGFDLPPAKAGVKLVDPENVDELVRLLHEEAKAI